MLEDGYGDKLKVTLGGRINPLTNIDKSNLSFPNDQVVVSKTDTDKGVTDSWTTTLTDSDWGSNKDFYLMSLIIELRYDATKAPGSNPFDPRASRPFVSARIRTAGSAYIAEFQWTAEKYSFGLADPTVGTWRFVDTQDMTQLRKIASSATLEIIWLLRTSGQIIDIINSYYIGIAV